MILTSASWQAMASEEVARKNHWSLPWKLRMAASMMGSLVLGVDRWVWETFLITDEGSCF